MYLSYFVSSVFQGNSYRYTESSPPIRFPLAILDLNNVMQTLDRMSRQVSGRPSSPPHCSGLSPALEPLMGQPNIIQLQGNVIMLIPLTKWCLKLIKVGNTQKFLAVCCTVFLLF